MIANGVSYLVADNRIYQIAAIGAESIEFFHPVTLEPGSEGTIYAMLHVGAAPVARTVRFPVGVVNGLRVATDERDVAQVGDGTQMITIRIPALLHAALKDEAHRRRTSLNRLCIAKLVARSASDSVAATDGQPSRAQSAPAPLPTA